MMQAKRDDDAGQLMEFVKRYVLSLNSLLRFQPQPDSSHNNIL